MMPLPGAQKEPKTALLFSLEGPQLLKVHEVCPKLHKWVLSVGTTFVILSDIELGLFGGVQGPEMVPFGLSHQDKATEILALNFFLQYSHVGCREQRNGLP